MTLPERSFKFRATDEATEPLVSKHTFFNFNGVAEGSNILPSTVILHFKRDTDGRPIIFEARLASIENLQSRFDSMDDLYAPFDSIELVRTLLQVMQTKNWRFRHLDIKRAILTIVCQKMNKFALNFQHYRTIRNSQERSCTLKVFVWTSPCRKALISTVSPKT